MTRRCKIKDILTSCCLFSVLLCSGLDRAYTADRDPEPIGGRPFERGVLQPADRRWQSGDGAFSVPLGQDRRLWLFGDSRLAINATGLTMTSNTIALQEGGCRNALDVFWNDKSDRPRAFFTPKKGAGWLWPAGGIVARGVLYLFYYRVNRLPPGGRWDFGVQDSVVMRVTNPQKNPPEWPTPRRLESRNTRNVVIGLSPFVRERHLMVFASRERQQRREAVLARTELPDLEDSHTIDWQFYTGDAHDTWSADQRRARALFPGVGTEFTIVRLPGGRRWAAVYTPRGIGPKVVMRQAAHPRGPWGHPRTILQCREAEVDPDLFCYGAKLHPSCSRNMHDLWITYSIQAREGRPLPSHLGRPQWVRLPWPERSQVSP